MRPVLYGFCLGIVLGSIVILFGSCVHGPELVKYDTNHTRKFFCESESCPAFTQVHSYTLLTTSYDEKSSECVCKVMSDNSPDEWEVRIPIDAPADSPVDSL